MQFPFLQFSFSTFFSNKVLKRSIFRTSTRGTASISLLLLSGNISTTARAWSAVSSGTNGLIRTSSGKCAKTCFGSSSSSFAVSSKRCSGTLSSTLPGLPSPLTTLAASTTSDDREDSVASSGNAQKKTEGKTGWNHNPPKNPDFWKTDDEDSQTIESALFGGAAGEVEAIAKTIAAEEKSKAQLRTGWLHNTQSSDTKKQARGAASSSSSESKMSSAAGKARRRLEDAMKAKRENHRIVSPGTLHALGKDRKIVVTEHRMSVPLVHPPETTETTTAFGGLQRPMMVAPPTASIDVAFTIVEEIVDEETSRWYERVFPKLNPHQRASEYLKRCAMTSAKDMLLFLQGGPGFGAPTPVVGLDFAKGGASWGSSALDRYRRVVLMDQRGTGRSSPLTKQSLENRFPDLFGLDDIENTNATGETTVLDAFQQSHPEELQKFTDSLEKATDFLAQFRADSIVRDAELIRKLLMYTSSLEDEDKAGDDDTSSDLYDPSLPNPWGCVLGQSYGGFCTMTYLSQIEHPPKFCLFTGGIAPMLANSAVDVYTSLWKRVRERNLRYYDVYPGDVIVVKTIVRQLLLAEEQGTIPVLPSGGRLTARRFLQLGLMLGSSPSVFASMHELLSSAFLQPWSDQDKNTLEFSRGFLKAIDHAQPFDEHPIYFWLHESIYADGGGGEKKSSVATNWSAQRSASIVTGSSGASEWDYRATSREDSNLPVLFFGEMVFPWMAEDYAECGGLGCKTLADSLADKTDWGPLYDSDRIKAMLGDDGISRSAAAVYYDDMYVDFDLSMEVAARGGPLENCKVYVTNEYQHSGLRDDGAAIFNKLHGMATGNIRTPS